MQLFVENLLKVLKVLKTQLEAARQLAGKVTSCSSYGAPRLAHDLQGKILLTFFKKNLDFSKNMIQ